MNDHMNWSADLRQPKPERPQRRLKQPRKSTLREWLASAADTIEAQKAEIERWKAKCDAAVAELGGEVDRLRFAALASLIVGLLLGGWLL